VKTGAVMESATRVAYALFEVSPSGAQVKGVVVMRMKMWMERVGVSLKQMAMMVGYDKTTLWHALNDRNYRKRLSRKFWGRVGAVVRWKIKPIALRLEDEGIKMIRCPHCRSFIQVKVKAKADVIIEPLFSHHETK